MNVNSISAGAQALVGAVWVTLARNVVLAMVLFGQADAALAAAGCLTQETLPAGCVSEGGSGGCSSGTGLNGAAGVAISPDGENAYTVAFLSDTLAVFDRDSITGLLTQKAGTAGCFSDTGSGGACVDAVALDIVTGVTVSGDGKNVYVTTGSPGGLAIFDRNLSTGALTQKAGTAGCITNDGSGGACADGTALTGSASPVVSADGKNVYVVASNFNAIAVFDRNVTTGELTQKAGTDGCVSDSGTGGACTDGVAMLSMTDLALSPDGANLYASAGSSHAVVIFDRDTGTGVLTQKAGTAACISEDGTGGACADGNALTGAIAIAVSQDGENVYMAQGLASGSDSVAVFDRDTMTGALTQKAGLAGCVSRTGTSGTCTVGRNVFSVFDVAVSADDTNVYTSANDSHGISIFDRDLGTGAITQRTGIQGCINRMGTEGCAIGTAMTDANQVVISPDDGFLYMTASTSDSVVTFVREDAGVCLTTTTSTTTTTTTLPPGGCPATPRTSCSTEVGKARVAVRDTSDNLGDRVNFVWKQGQATTLDQFHDPASGGGALDLCIYANGNLVDTLSVPTSPTCGGAPCWIAAGSRRFVYEDKDRANDGVRSVVLKAGADGDAKIVFEAKGAATPLPALSLTTPVVVQVVLSDSLSEDCWEATFATALRNSTTSFAAVVK